ncbi:class A beta-lactamase [Kribbella deserti]|uniref:Beta-lactamase n=1 Tax=Kribbella deserti TaxID=1926257 RepID=A0ABV6QGG2_9ACTN
MIRDTPLSRRSLLGAGLAVSTAGLLAGNGFSLPAMATGSVRNELSTLEREHDARLGVYGLNTRTGATVAYRADERFPMCSTFKTLASAAILRDRDCNGEFLNKVIRYTKKDLVAGSPITQEHVGKGMRVADLCHAAICYSDNTAANLLLRQLGGPYGVTRFCRSIGDLHSRLDRYETELNTAIPGDVRDTTTPSAMGANLRRLVLGNALNERDREQLTAWLKANTTSKKRFGAGLPSNWVLGDKTGSGDYGTANDVGVAWTTAGTPLVLAVYTTKHTKDAVWDDALIAKTARILASTLAPGE